MNDEATFLDALTANPFDDKALRDYAAWLTERGDPRGEFLCLLRTPAGNRARLVALRKELDNSWLSALDQRTIIRLKAVADRVARMRNRIKQLISEPDGPILVTDTLIAQPV